MKKIIIALVMFAGISTASAQDMKYGVKAGVDLYSQKVTFPGIPGFVPASTTTVTGTGFYVGGFINFAVSDKFAVQPEVAYVAVEGSGFLNVPILGKYMFAEKFHALAGPSINYFLDAKEDAFKLNVDFGASYDITEKIDVNARYSLGFGDVAVNGIFIGANYAF